MTDNERVVLFKGTVTYRHKHRVLTVKPHGLVYRILRAPIYWTANEAKVDASPYPYGVAEDWHVTEYYLSLLSVLHRWTGLTLTAGPRRCRASLGRGYRCEALAGHRDLNIPHRAGSARWDEASAWREDGML